MTSKKLVDQILSALRADFSDLVVHESHPPDVEWAVELPKQEGLSFSIYFELVRNDALMLYIEDYNYELFEQLEYDEAVAAFIGAVVGFISGKYRLEKHYRGDKLTSVFVQESVEDNWKTISRSYIGTLTFPWQKKEIRFVQNVKSVE